MLAPTARAGRMDGYSSSITTRTDEDQAVNRGFSSMVLFPMTFSCASAGPTACSIAPTDRHGRMGTFDFAANHAKRGPGQSSSTAQAEIESPIRPLAGATSSAQNDWNPTCQRQLSCEAKSSKLSACKSNAPTGGISASAGSPYSFGRETKAVRNPASLAATRSKE